MQASAPTALRLGILRRIGDLLLGARIGNFPGPSSFPSALTRAPSESDHAGARVPGSPSPPALDRTRARAEPEARMLQPARLDAGGSKSAVADALIIRWCQNAKHQSIPAASESAFCDACRENCKNCGADIPKGPLHCPRCHSWRYRSRSILLGC